MYIKNQHKLLSMSKKTVTGALSKKIDMINLKVKEINDRRRGMKITRIEDDLDRQELDNYARFLGLEKGDVSLESAEAAELPARNSIFYATLAVEALIELFLVYLTFSILSAANLGYKEYLMAAALIGMFAYIAYLMARSLRAK